MDIKIGIAEMPPGKTVTAAQIICQALFLNCTFIPYDGTEYGDGLENGTATGMLGAVQRGEFDTFEPLFTPTYRRHKAVDFSDPLFYEGVLMVTRAPRSHTSSFSLNIVSALGWQTWLVFTGALLLTSAFIGGMIWHSHPEQPGFHWFMDIFMALITHKHEDEKCVSLHIRLLIVGWSLSAMVLTSSYTAMLFSEKMKVTATLPYTDFESFVTCLETGRCRIIIGTMVVSYCLVLFDSENTLGKRAQAAFAIWPPIILSPVSAIEEQILADQDTFLVWLGSRGEFLANFKSEGCPYYVIEAPYLEPWTFPLRKNSSLKKILNKAAVAFMEYGVDEGVSAHSEDGAVCYQSQTRGILNDNSLSTVYVASCFLAAGVLAGFFILMLEIVVKRWKVKSEKGKLKKLFVSSVQ